MDARKIDAISGMTDAERKALDNVLLHYHERGVYLGPAERDGKLVLAIEWDVATEEDAPSQLDLDILFSLKPQLLRYYDVLIDETPEHLDMWMP